MENPTVLTRDLRPTYPSIMRMCAHSPPVLLWCLLWDKVQPAAPGKQRPCWPRLCKQSPISQAFPIPALLAAPQEASLCPAGMCVSLLTDGARQIPLGGIQGAAVGQDSKARSRGQSSFQCSVFSLPFKPTRSGSTRAQGSCNKTLPGAQKPGRKSISGSTLDEQGFISTF